MSESHGLKSPALTTNLELFLGRPSVMLVNSQLDWLKQLGLFEIFFFTFSLLACLRNGFLYLSALTTINIQHLT